MKKPEPIELENNLGPDAVTGEINRVPWMAYDVDEMDLYIAELNAKLSEKDKEIESLKASHYAESVDAGMENRKLKRALWLARAERAKARKNYWYARCLHEGDDFLVSIDGSPVKYIGCIKRTNYDWLLTWSEVERKCLAKAEQYK